MAFRVNNGEIWDSFLANAALVTIPDGNTELPGHAPKIIDEWLSDNQTQLKAKFYDWYENFEVSSAGGLTVDIKSGVILDDTGYTVLSTAQVILPDNSSGYLVITETKTVNFFTSLPQRCYPLAFIETSSGQINSITDIREQKVNRISDLKTPSAFETGDIKVTTRKVISPGWLLCNGAYISTSTYNNLFNIIGYSYGQQGSLFRLPLGGKCIRSSTDVEQIGSYLGDDQVLVNTSNMPRHSHGVNQSPHNHAVNDSGHNHGSYNLGHSHGVNQSPHSHPVSDPGHGHTSKSLKTTNLLSPGDTRTDGIYIGDGNQNLAFVNSGTGISIQNTLIPLSVGFTNLGLTTENRVSGVSINSSLLNLSINDTGSNVPLDIIPASILLNMWIKT